MDFLMDASAVLKTMISAADHAACQIRKDFVNRSSLNVAEKTGPDDLCTSTDIAAQKIIKDILFDSYPDIGFIGEEGCRSLSKDSKDQWLVDPLDGTMNFIRGIPIFAVNIALIRGGLPFAGVTYVPLSEELFYAERGCGAFLNGHKISVSNKRTLLDSIVSVAIPSPGKPSHHQFVAEMSRLTPRIGQIRRLGACAVEMAYVACGRIDAYWEQSVSAWDIAAGVVLVEEAGGVSADTQGNDLDIFAGTCLVTTPQLKDELTHYLREASIREET
jgi:myo-inositol-1(or 4)-monophosphatase